MNASMSMTGSTSNSGDCPVSKGASIGSDGVTSRSCNRSCSAARTDRNRNGVDSSMHAPAPTPKPACRLRSSAAPSNALLPIPASPPMSSTRARPPATSAMESSIRCSSVLRPMSDGAAPTAADSTSVLGTDARENSVEVQTERVAGGVEHHAHPRSAVGARRHAHAQFDSAAQRPQLLGLDRQWPDPTTPGPLSSSSVSPRSAADVFRSVPSERVGDTACGRAFRLSTLWL